MRSSLSYLTMLHNKDLICIFGGRNALSNNYLCAWEVEIAETFLNLFFRLKIDSRRCVIKDKDRRSYCKCSRKRNSLLLSTGKAYTSVAYNSLLAFRHLGNEV